MNFTYGIFVFIIDIVFGFNIILIFYSISSKLNHPKKYTLSRAFNLNTYIHKQSFHFEELKIPPLYHK